MTITTREKFDATVGLVIPTQRRSELQPRRGMTDLESASGGLRFLPLVALAADLICVVIATIVASLGRDHLSLFQVSPDDFAPQLLQAAPAVTVGWLLAIALLGGYDSQVFGAGTSEFRRVLNSGLATAALVGVGSYLVKFPLSRGFFVLVFAIGVPLLLTSRALLRISLKRARKRGLLQHRVLIVGDTAHIDDIASVLARESWLGYDVVGALAPSDLRQRTPLGVSLLGDTTDVAARALELEADVVFFAGGAVTSAAQLRKVGWALEHTHTQIVVAPSLTDVSRERVKVRPVGGLPLIHLEKPRSVAAGRRAKRVFDLVGSLTILALLSPIYLFAAAQIWWHDRGPLLFEQERIGRGGEAFKCFKFRSMVVDAEARLAEAHTAQGSDSNTVFYKLKDDPRITPPGRWLRRFSVDELPQLLNVVKGDMSLVGPRPQVAHEVALYDDAMSRRLHVRPGMTGLWQVSGRSDLPMAEAIRLDLYYVDNWSMVQDLSILARTLGAVVGSRGAY